MNNGFISAGVNLAFSYAAGEAASRFLIALRDEQKIYGTRCPACGRVLVPARSFCPRCFVDTTEWIEVGPAGTLVALAPASRPQASRLQGAPTDLPIGLIRLDGADTSLMHFIGETERGALRIGLRVAAVFAEARSGSILDIAYFKVRADTFVRS
jgi:hypothetical protein